VEFVNKLGRIGSVSSKRYVLFIALFFTLFHNVIALFDYSKLLVEAEKIDYAVLITLPIVIFALMVLVFNLLVWRYVTKPIIVFLIIFSAIVLFASKEYGIIFDHTMLQNFYETDTSESFTYINFSSVSFVIFAGLLPAILFSKIRVEFKNVLTEIKEKLIVTLASLAVIAAVIFPFYQNYAAFMRNNENFKRSIIPTYYLSSLVKFVNLEFLATPQPFLVVGADAKQMRPTSLTKQNIVVVVVGETARAMNFAYNGYKRDTNSFTRPFSPISFADMSSCATTTAISVPCMFSYLSQQNYDGNRARNADNVLDIIARAGVETRWIDNNSGCKGVCDRIPSTQIPVGKDNALCDGFYCFDAVLLDELEKELNEESEKDKLVVLHMIGSHGPTYYKRYPSEFRAFVPDCQRSDIQNCSREELVNTYDNTIHYSDYILSEAIKLLNTFNGKANVSLLFVSDHGESLGENGVYLHGIPYSFAPKEQTHIPMLFWMSSEFEKYNQIDRTCLQQLAASETLDHDLIFHSLLGLTHVHTDVYDESLDIFAGCRLAP
jgi:lipid A ethanolaminephosphotransferase